MDVLVFFSSRRRHTRFDCDWSSDVCSSDLSFSGGSSARNYTYEGDDDWCTGQINLYARFGGNNYQIGFLMDMNGDGLADRVMADWSNSSDDNRSQAEFQIAFNEGDGWGSTATWLDPYQGLWPGASDGN